ncbi:heat shock protein transcriptional repressor HspR [Tessaracoccus sp. MC1756]|uniref:heat shock protein transcriptional repressor HspR n=1 Tax=Tessaracoccus sp. MC1756 TaxID=2760311 RepID=UPI0016018B4C|nr:MerR family transcriptional regulator [Tessaracoccus sp. MC1756]MBB1509909.1 MerR family transcriptional regulator [Tessaracoccus sp. MC1756]
MSQHLQPFDPDAAVFPVSVAASLADMHAQTLRGYDRLGLVVPQRARGRGRRYSLRDIAKLRHVQYLSQTEGINLEGIRRILALEEQVDAMRDQVERLSELVRRIQSDEMAARVFTAESSGRVHQGRYRPQRRLALPPSAT